jgi:hypothetical protein
MQLARALALVLLAACNERSSVAGAAAPPEAPLPIKFETCDGQGSDCKVTARFSDFHGCEFYKKYSDALCDSITEPGFAKCDVRRRANMIATTRCTR